MFGFVDETTIEVSSGHGGPGSVSFRREKYVPRGGPDGGDGGRGGDVVFVVARNLKTLSHLKRQHAFHAENGMPGMGRKQHGRDGQDVVISVPPGTILRDSTTKRVIKDLGDAGNWTFLKGGRGGQGNTHFSTARRQAPRFAQPGEEGQASVLDVELNLIADVGFIGYPNAGKSTLLSVLTNANPRIGSWPFTTRVPNLGVLRKDDRELVLADIPGIIEGASHGVGLGLRFLKHIERTRALVVLIDLSTDDAMGALPVLLGELATYHQALIERPRLVVGTKLDITESVHRFEELCALHPDEKMLGISAVTRVGIDDLVERMFAVAG